MFMLKAIVAGIVAVAGSLGSAATTGHITLAEVFVAVGAGAVAVGGVYGVTNVTAKPTPPAA